MTAGSIAFASPDKLSVSLQAMQGLLIVLSSSPPLCFTWNKAEGYCVPLEFETKNGRMLLKRELSVHFSSVAVNDNRINDSHTSDKLSF